MKEFFNTYNGVIICGDSLEYIKGVSDNSVDLIITSPPYALLKSKKYGNETQEDYLKWFKDFAIEFKRVLKDSGSFVLDIGSAWNKGEATKSLYHFRISSHKQ